MPIPSLQPTNLLRQALLAWERSLRKGDDAKKRNDKRMKSPDPESRDTDRPPQIW